MKSLINYTTRYLIYSLPFILAVWALLFYAFIAEEVYDNIDDGLKNQKINIIRESYMDSTLFEINEFGVNQFRILPTENVDFQNNFSKAKIFMEYDDDLEPYRILKTGFYAPNGKPYSLEIRTSTIEEDDFLGNLLLALMGLYVMIILTIYVVNNMVLKKALKPFKKILEGLQSYQFGEKNTMPDLEIQVEEFDILNNKIKEMITRNEAVYTQQKNFIENAAHELQTPIAIAQNQLELILDDEKLNESQIQKLSETKGVLHRMSTLNKSLLTLSRIENRQFESNTELSVNEIVKGTIDKYNDLLDFKNIITNIIENGKFSVRANPDLMNILLSNLVGNAIKYNLKNGDILIKIDTNEFSISNPSLLPPQNADQIFERFYKNTGDSGSTGLGLSIVKSILNNYPNLKIKYSYKDSRHIFKVSK